MEQGVSFGRHRFDLETGRLWSGKREVRLTPKASSVLKALVTHAGQPVRKDELFASVWKDTVVSDDALTSCIQELRRALGDDAKRPRFIETRHRRGYQFVARVSEEAVKDAADSRAPTPTMERHIAAILAADVVGYGRLMEVDKAGTLAALKARRRNVLEPLVAKHRGRVFKVAGDGVLVEFASPVNAVQCAVDLQQGMSAANSDQREDRHIILRVGVNLGDVMVEGGDPYGDGVNIATRLETIAEPGAIVISGTAYDQVRNKVKVVFDELGAQNLKNIAEPVRAYCVAGTPVVTIAPPKATTDKPSIAVLPFTNMSGDAEQHYFTDVITEDINLLKTELGIAPGKEIEKLRQRMLDRESVEAALSDGLAAGGASYSRFGDRAPAGNGVTAESALRLPEKPSIAVLPFANLSGDPEQDYFADGVVEEMITALSRFRWLFVIARNSSFTYKGRAVDIKQVGKELGVRYVLEGSVRKSAERVRIAGQLVDTSTGAHLWADRFDSKMESIFDLQDQVTSNVVGAIAPRLEQAEIERARRKPTESLDAYDCYLRGTAALHQWTREGNEEALSNFYYAIELDPRFASAYGLAARCYAQRRANGWVTDRANEIAEVTRLARLAVDLGKDDAVALCTAGFALAIVVDELEDGDAFINRALVLNPNYAVAWLFSGWVKISLGEPEGAIERITRAMRLSPQDAHMFTMYAAMASAHLIAGSYAVAYSWAEMAVREKPDILLSTCVAAASSALAGRLAEAQKMMGRLREAAPHLRISNLRDVNSYLRPTHFEKWAEGLRIAGLPE